MNRDSQHKLAVAANLLVAAVGVYLIFSPHLLGHEDTAAAKVERFLAPLIGAFGLISSWECTRGVRWLNLLNAAALVGLAVSPWPSYPTPAIVSDVLCGLVVIGLTLLPHPRVGSYGGGWRRLLKSP